MLLAHLFFVTPKLAAGWSFLYPFSRMQDSCALYRRNDLVDADLVLAPCMAAAVLVSVCCAPPTHAAVISEDASLPSSLVEYSSVFPGIKAPTVDQPQIRLPGADDGVLGGGTAITSPHQQQRGPLLQGLVYLRDPANGRPDPTDTLFVTARVLGDTDDNAIVMGARVAVSRLRFPTQFNLYAENVRAGVRASSFVERDLTVDARVCPTSTTPCADEDAVSRASGIAKVVRDLPGMEPGTTVRAAASLGL